MQRLTGLPASQPYALVAESTIERPLVDVDTVAHRTMHRQETPLSRAFFGTQNIDVLQLAIRDAVRRATKHDIDRQSDDQLLAYMRYIFIEYSSNSTSQDVAAEIKALNDIVVKYTVPDIVANLLTYLAYLRDASRLPEPVPRGAATSVIGTRTTAMIRDL